MRSAIHRAYEELEQEATCLAGGLGDLALRAHTYRQIFRDSQGNHYFPLIAAHGAMWAGGQFRFAMKLGRLLAWQYAWSKSRREEQLTRLADFCDALRDINRRVCIHTYVQFHLTRQFRHHPEIDEFVTERIFRPLCLVHEACEMNRRLTNTQRRMVFEAHFLNEQEMVVGDALTQAVGELEWPLVRFIALRPRIRFAYLPAGRCIPFGNFADRNERVANGMLAFDAAASMGWRHVEDSLNTSGWLDKVGHPTTNTRSIAEVAAAMS